MRVSDIIKAVRWCIDEEAVNATNLEGASAFDVGSGQSDNGLMNNIITDKIGTALRWVCLYAPAQNLSGTTNYQVGTSSSTTKIEIIKELTFKAAPNHRIELGSDFIRLIRVRGSNWHKAVSGDSVIEEDSQEYLELMNSDGAAATNDRPQAAIINTKYKKLEVWPSEGNLFDVTYMAAPPASSFENLSPDTAIGIPPMVETSFIYYLAYLLLTAYGDGRAKGMLEVAMANLGKTEDKQRL